MGVTTGVSFVPTLVIALNGVLATPSAAFHTFGQRPFATRTTPIIPNAARITPPSFTGALSENLLLIEEVPRYRHHDSKTNERLRIHFLDTPEKLVIRNNQLIRWKVRFQKI